MSESTADQPPAIRGDLNDLKRDLLFAIAHCDGWPDAPRRYLPSGTEVREEVAAARGEQLAHNANYRALRVLVDEGLVERRPLDGRSKGHRLTEAGLAVCERQIEWMVNGLDGDSP